MKLLLPFILFIAIFSTSCSNDDNTGPASDDKSIFLTQEQQKKPYSIKTTLAKTVNETQYYRIPAIIVTDKDTIVAVYDNRGTKNSDIGFSNPNVNVTSQRSTDGGLTWSKEINVGGVGTSIETVHGDALLFNATNGDLVILSAAGGAWFSAPSNPSRVSVSISKDDGITWSTWKDVIDGDTFLNNETLKSHGIKKGFMASGRGLTLKDGRLIGSMLGGSANGSTIKAAVSVYSDDNGETWKIGGVAKYPDNNKGDEPKIIAELNDGTLLLSARPNSTGLNRIWSYSKDKGLTWTDGITTIDLLDGRANAEGVRYTSTLSGHDKDRILFLNCNDVKQRTKLTVHISTDEGTNWTVGKILQEGTACYSSIDVLKDGTIVTFAEEQSEASGLDNYDLVFRRFNLYWLTDGRESYNNAY